MLKKNNTNSTFISYFHNKKFGPYYLPARYQYVILRDYFSKFNKPFILPQLEPVYSKTLIRLRSMINSLKPGDHIVALSVYVLSIDKKLRNIILQKAIKKKIKMHFIFEGIITNSKKDFSKIENFFKLNNFLE